MTASTKIEKGLSKSRVYVLHDEGEKKKKRNTIRLRKL